MNLIIKTYEITYIAGLVTPAEFKIKVETSNPLNEDFIYKEIYKQKPYHKDQIHAILSTLLIGEKEIKINENNSKENINTSRDKNYIPPFNW